MDIYYTYNDIQKWFVRNIRLFARLQTSLGGFYIRIISYTPPPFIQMYTKSEMWHAKFIVIIYFPDGHSGGGMLFRYLPSIGHTLPAV